MQINVLMLYLKLLEKDQIKPKAHRREEIIKIRAETDATEIKKTYKESMN